MRALKKKNRSLQYQLCSKSDQWRTQTPDQRRQMVHLSNYVFWGRELMFSRVTVPPLTVPWFHSTISSLCSWYEPSVPVVLRCHRSVCANGGMCCGPIDAPAAIPEQHEHSQRLLFKPKMLPFSASLVSGGLMHGN